MRGEKADMVFTDPPYNQAENRDMGVSELRPDSYGTLKNSEWDKNFNFLDGADLILNSLKSNCSVYVCMQEFTAPDIWQWMGEWADYYSYCVWVKDNPMPSLTKKRWTWATELVAYGTRGKLTFNFPINGHALNWWQVPVSQKNRYHPTEKPVSLVSIPIEMTSNRNSLILDPFLGSGTTLIAANSLNRRCYGIELSPPYVAVTLQRYQDTTNQTPTRLTTKDTPNVQP
jgi:site-specific DNA-methyltransferase (adenine-specific)